MTQSKTKKRGTGKISKAETLALQEEFLKCYLLSGAKVMQALDSMNSPVSKMTISNWRRRDKNFLINYNAIKDSVTDAIEEAARSMAISQKHPAVTMFMLSRLIPERYNHEFITAKLKKEQGITDTIPISEFKKMFCLESEDKKDN